MSHRRRVALLAVAVPLAMVAALPAAASFNSAPTAPAMGISSGSIAAPTTSGATGSCNGTLQVKVVVTWGITSSTFATGYQVWRKVGAGVFAQVGTINSRNTLTFTDTTVVGLTTYVYVVRSTYQNWVSTDSPQASATTPLAVTCL